MAQSLISLRQTVHKHLITKVETLQGAMLPLCTPAFDPQAIVKVHDIGGGGNYTTKTTTGAPSASAVRSLASESNPVEREQLIKFEASRLLDLDSLAMEIAERTFGYGWQEINTDFFLLLMSGRTTAHPENGVSGSAYAANGGGTVYAVDNFDMTFLDTTTLTQTNDHTLALSSANLSTVLAKGITYRDLAGKGLNRTTAKPYLVVAPELADLGNALAAQQGRAYDGSGLALGFSGRLAGVITAPAGTCAADAWAVVWVDEMSNGAGGLVKTGPVLSHIRELVSVRIGMPTDAGDIHVYSKFIYDNHYHPTVDQRLMYSEP